MLKFKRFAEKRNETGVLMMVDDELKTQLNIIDTSVQKAAGFFSCRKQSVCIRELRLVGVFKMFSPK